MELGQLYRKNLSLAGKKYGKTPISGIIAV
jgi:hypothetical protein